MSSSINQSMSLFVPHVFTNISDARIKRVFATQDLGAVRTIDRILKKDRDGKNYHSIYIHFESWEESETVANFQEKVRAKEGRIVYDDPWFWSVFENSGKKHQSGDRKPVIKMDVNDKENFPTLGTNAPPAAPPAPAPAPAFQYQQPDFYMPQPYMLPQYPLPQFMMQQPQEQYCYEQQEQMFVASDYVSGLEQEMTRLVAENMWLKNMVADFDAA